MKGLKFFTCAVLVLVGAVGLSHQVLADSAPPKPEFPNAHVTVKVGLGNLSSKFVLIKHDNKFADSYAEAKGTVEAEGYGATTYFAIDKDYFKKNGGIDGLFNVLPMDAVNEFGGMLAKNGLELAQYRYQFVVMKNDPLLKHAFGRFELEPVGQEYVRFPFRSDFYIRQGADDPTCNTGYNIGSGDDMKKLRDCVLSQKTAVYMPQQVVGKNIVLADTASTQKQAVKKDAKLAPAELPPMELLPNNSRWARTWRWIKSLF